MADLKLTGDEAPPTMNKEIAIGHSESVGKPFKGTIEDWIVLWGKVLGKHLERNITTSYIHCLTANFVETKNSVYALGTPADGQSRTVEEK